MTQKRAQAVSTYDTPAVAQPGVAASPVKRIRRKDTAPLYRAGYGKPEEMAAYEAHEQVCVRKLGRKSDSSRQRPEVATYSATSSIKPAPASHRQAEQGPPKANPNAEASACQVDVRVWR